MNSHNMESAAFDRNTGTGRIELSSQGSFGHYQATDEVPFNCNFESAIIRYFLLMFIPFFVICYFCCFVVFVVLLLLLFFEIFIAFVW